MFPVIVYINILLHIHLPVNILVKNTNESVIYHCIQDTHENGVFTMEHFYGSIFLEGFEVAP